MNRSSVMKHIPSSGLGISCFFLNKTTKVNNGSDVNLSPIKMHLNGNGYKMH